MSETPISSSFETMLTQAEVAELLKRSYYWVGDATRRGELRGKKVGRYWRFKYEWVLQYMNECESSELAPDYDPLATTKRSQMAHARLAA